MAIGEALGVVVEPDEGGEHVRAVYTHGMPRLNKEGVEIANFRRSERDSSVFVFAEPVSVIGIQGEGWLIQVGNHTFMYIDPSSDNYFL